MKIIILILNLFLFSFFTAQQKHALVIAVGEYSDKWTKNWTNISSLHDVDLISTMLNEQQFKNENIKLLKNQEATVPNIEKAFEELIKNAQKGDIIYFHYSGHGQQVPDLESGYNKYFKADEHDGWDEALVTYFAPVNFEEAPEYNYEHHFVDDQLNYYINRLREKIGKTGQIIVILDSCHSGTGTRGADDLGTVRGTDVPCAPKGYTPKINSELPKNKHTENDFAYSSGSDLGVLTVFSGCKANQVNRECIDGETGIHYGSLSYYLVKSMTQLGENASYRNLFDKINERMAIEFSNDQQPVIEGDELDQLIFKGTFVKQEPYFKVEELTNYYTEAKINGGSLHGLQEGDSIGLYFHSVVNPKDTVPEYKGVISSTSIISSEVKLDQPYKGANNEFVKYRAFLTKSKTEPMSLSVKLDIDNKKLKKELTKRFENLQSIQMTDKNYTYVIRDTILDKTNNETGVIVYLAHNGLTLRNMSPMQLNNDEDYAELIKRLNHSVKSKFFRELTSSANRINIDISNPVDILLKNKGKLKCTIKNNGATPIYLYVIDIKPDETMELVLGRRESIKIHQNEPYILEGPVNCGDSDNPCGKEQLKIICSIEELNLAPLLKMGESLKKRSGDKNPFAIFMEDAVKGTRGFNANNEISVDVQNVFFEISE